ncbi:MAG: 7-cyano-7-deazaguanine synthase QueC [Actinobacteria bacterium]|nr:7-cyano-7-deazaguanine synthase QueC [Actinomycetota bacterium]
MSDTTKKGVVVLLSGGQDSSTCLALAMSTWGHDKVWPLIIDYGQRHLIEIDCAVIVARAMGAREPRILGERALLELGGAALTDANVNVNADATDTGNAYAEAHGLPSTFVPGRNLLFFTLAAAYAAKVGAQGIVTGVCEADRAGYPDCRSEFVDAAKEALRTALDDPEFDIYAPLLHLSKAGTFELAARLDVLDVIIESTNTCYHGNRDIKHEWGRGCGGCPACAERESGWQSFVAGKDELSPHMPR